ncbi:n-terminal binuclear zn cluster-containing [Trichoderma arundinaceum]|uniref:N-terminal binuclear zn cluster-containing n=1 Tax=Trichoderma arundinaceum TaxID=490622 RepID=A0A395NR69_TRIAR|nr:n-terminal binuclear zn cluster-containing [Trichoderma arundinaceum]
MTTIVVSPISSLLTDHSSTSAETSQPSPDYESLHITPSHSSGTDFLTERFLDPEAFSSAQLKLPEPDVDYLITRDVSDFVGDVPNIKAISDQFFHSVHEWMPIVSKIQFRANLVGWLTHKRAELFYLILAMKLSCEHAPGPRTPLYQITKLMQFRIENSGVLSLQVIQASVLIAIYEMGHGIYPSAFLSIAGCARYATALGIDKSILNNDVNISWNELEERRRVWWSILVLDRFLNLSNPSRHLVTPDTVLDNWLPVDDAAFNNGTARPEDAFTLGSATALVLGRFARFAQAAHLLGQVLRHVAEGSTESERAQLRRTIFSLSKYRDGPEASIVSLDQLSTESSLISQTALQMSVYVAQRAELEVRSRSSPFLLHLLYKVALLYMKASQSTPGDSITDKLRVVKHGLEVLGRRWHIAQSYLSLLSRHEIMQAMQ